MQKKHYIGHPRRICYFPNQWELDITKNYKGIQQDWSKNIMLYQVLDCNGDLKSFENLSLMNGPVKMEYDAMKATIGKKG